jgi:O-antigen/teichoic acid export membrane protein
MDRNPPARNFERVSIARKSLETMAFRIPTLALALATGVLIARVLGPVGKGSYAYVVTCMGVIAMYTVGQANAIAYEYGRRRRGVRPVLRNAVLIMAVTVVPAAVAMAAVALVIPSEAILLPIALAVPFLAVSQVLYGFFLADSDVTTVNRQQLLSAAVLPLLLLPALLFFRMGITGLLYSWVFTYVATTAYTLYRFRPYLQRDDSAQERLPVREQFLFGTMVSLDSVMAYLNFRIDVFIVLAMLGPGPLGIYSVGVGAGNLVWQITRPLVQAAFGRIGSSSESDAAHLTARIMRHSLLFVVPAAALLFFAGPAAAVLAYGHLFAGSGPVIRVLLPGIIAYSITPILSTFLSQQLGKPMIPVIVNTVATLVCASVTYLTIPRWGIVGGAFATSISYTLALIAQVVYFVGRTGVPWKRLFVPDATDLRAYPRWFEQILSGVWRRFYSANSSAS